MLEAVESVKFNGNNWNQFAQLTKDGHNNIWIENMLGSIRQENDIWAVGEILYLNDSLGSDPDPSLYNAVHWDGQSWELKNSNGFANGSVSFHTIAIMKCNWINIKWY